MLRDGIEGLLFDEKLPEDCIFWLKVECNNWGGGTGATIIEAYDIPDKADDFWLQFKQKNDIHWNTCPSSGPNSYAKMREREVLKVYGRIVKNWHMYRNLSTIVELDKKFSFLEDLKLFVHDFVDHDVCAPKIESIISLQKDIVEVVFAKSFADICDEDEDVLIIIA